MKQYDIMFYNYNFSGVVWYKSETRDLKRVCAMFGRYNAGDELTVFDGPRIVSRALYSSEKHDYIRVFVDPAESRI